MLKIRRDFNKDVAVVTFTNGLKDHDKITQYHPYRPPVDFNDIMDKARTCVHANKAVRLLGDERSMY